MRYHERMVMLSVIDGLWKDHLLAMDHLKEGIGLRGYAQQDPLVEYKRESFDMFEAMMQKFQEDTVRFLFRMQILGPDGQPVNAAPEPRRPAVRRLRRWPARPSRPRWKLRRARSPFPRGRLRRPSTRWRRSSSARSSASWRRPICRRRRRKPARAAPHGRKSGPQRPLPLRQRKKYKKCHGCGCRFRRSQCQSRGSCECRASLG
jgi:preprotein translocase subunit SecA